MEDLINLGMRLVRRSGVTFTGLKYEERNLQYPFRGWGVSGFCYQCFVPRGAFSISKDLRD
jgi:hypothetical protein